MAGLRHLLSRAPSLFFGAATYARYQQNMSGIAFTPTTKIALGAPLAIVAAALINSATSTNLPNAATKTFTPLTDGTAPLNNASRPSVATVTMADGVARLVYVLDVPRNVKLTVTHGSSIVALSLLVSGYDQYGEAMTELLAVTATGTSKTATGKKAFKWISSYAFTSAGDATADTAALAWDNSLGLPFKATANTDLFPTGNGTIDITGTVTAGDATTPTNVTGDIRGTYLPSSAPDGTKTYGGILFVTGTTKAAAFGGAQA